MAHVRKGWFKIPGVQNGDRTVDQQLRGLDRVLAAAPGKRVVDFGCAEGLIDKVLLERGADFVRGYEVVPEHVEVANRVCADFRQAPPRAEFFVQNLNDLDGIAGDGRPWDIALMLAILHKLKTPDAFLEKALREFRPGLLVIRTAGATPGYVKDPRGDNRLVQLLPFLTARGYVFERYGHGPFDEWTGYFVREG